MSAISVLGGVLALVSLVALAILGEWRAYRREQEIKEVKKELDNEIRNSGNLARIASLRKRLRDLA